MGCIEEIVYGTVKCNNNYDNRHWWDEPQEKLGKWLITPKSNIAYCSECDYIFKNISANIVKQFKYCPNCGVRMESEDKE